MKVLIEIPKETYTEVKNKLRGTFLNPKDEYALIQSFRNGKVLDNKTGGEIIETLFSDLEMLNECNGVFYLYEPNSSSPLIGVDERLYNKKYKGEE